MIRRPLCLICLLLMGAIWLLELVGVSVGGHPQASLELTSLISDGASCQIYGRINQIEEKNDQIYLYLTSSQVVTSTTTVTKIKTRIKTEEIQGVSIGNTVLVHAELIEMPAATNPGQFDTALYFRRQGIDAFAKARKITVLNSHIDTFKNKLYLLRKREKRLLLALSPEQGGVLSAMLLGDKTILDEETKEKYRIAGMIHLISISGTHLSLLGMCIVSLLTHLSIDRRISVLTAACILVVYGIFTGSAVSTIRAVIMFSVYAGAILLGRTYDLLSGTALAAILLLLGNPGYLFAEGFLLSFGAVVGIGVISPCLKEVPPLFRISMSVFLIQFPILISTYYEISVLSMLMNLIVIPMLPFILGSGFIGMLIGNIGMTAAKYAMLPAVWMLKGYDLLCDVSVAFPFSTWITGCPTKLQVLLYFAIVILWVYLCKQKRKAVLRWGILAIGCVVLLFRVPCGFRFTVLDVGQGDCLLLDTPAGHHYMIDGGSSSVDQVGKYRIAPCLKYRNIHTLEGIFITHGDEDHVNGILELLEEKREGMLAIKIKKLFLPHWMKKNDDKEIAQKARQAGIEVVYLQKGNRMIDGKTTIQVLHPDGADYGEDENNGSLTMKVTCPGMSLLLTGDLGEEGERKLLEDDIACQILKVGHHGSKGSTGETLLEKVSPELALISCGKNNRYGHPHDETLERLEAVRCEVRRTDTEGAIILKAKLSF